MKWVKASDYPRDGKKHFARWRNINNEWKCDELDGEEIYDLSRHELNLEAEWLDEDSPDEPPSPLPASVEEKAREYAGSLGYKSDKEQHTTTPWTEWNIRHDAFLAGASIKQEWVRVEDRLPEEGQIVDIWEMPLTHNLETNLSLRGSDYAKQYLSEPDYVGWRSCNYKHTIEYDDEGKIHCFIKVREKHFDELTSYRYKKLCVENGEVTHWQPIPEPPKTTKQ